MWIFKNIFSTNIKILLESMFLHFEDFSRFSQYWHMGGWGYNGGCANYLETCRELNFTDWLKFTNWEWKPLLQNVNYRSFLALWHPSEHTGWIQAWFCEFVTLTVWEIFGMILVISVLLMFAVAPHWAPMLSLLPKCQLGSQIDASPGTTLWSFA